SSCSKPIKIILAAPTGKAALHLQSTILSKTGIECEAKTLHRLLRLKPGEMNLFSLSRIDADFVIVDESSMMDVSFLAHLFGSSVQVTDGFDDTLIDQIYEKIKPTFSPTPIDPNEFMQKNGKFACLNALRQGPFGLEVLNRKILEKMDRVCPDGFFWAIPIM